MTNDHLHRVDINGRLYIYIPTEKDLRVFDALTGEPVLVCVRHADSIEIDSRGEVPYAHFDKLYQAWAPGHFWKSSVYPYGRAQFAIFAKLYGGKRYQDEKNRKFAKLYGGETAPDNSVDTILGEIIEVTEGKVICWLQVSKMQRVKTSLDPSVFDGVPPIAGTEFLWYPDEQMVDVIEYDTGDIEKRCDELEKEWQDDLCHHCVKSMKNAEEQAERGI